MRAASVLGLVASLAATAAWSSGCVVEIAGELRVDGGSSRVGSDGAGDRDGDGTFADASTPSDGAPGEDGSTAPDAAAVGEDALEPEDARVDLDATSRDRGSGRQDVGSIDGRVMIDSGAQPEDSGPQSADTGPRPADTGPQSIDSGPGSTDTGVRPDTGARDTGAPVNADAAPTDTGAPANPDAGPPGPCALANQLSTAAVSVAPASISASWAIAAAPLSNGGAVIAWTASGGSVHLTTTDSSGARSGADVVIPGESGHAVGVTPNGVATLVRRRPAMQGLTDELWLIEVDAAGATRIEERLVGGNDSMVVGNEWFDGFFRRGRVLWNGSRISAYFTIQRRWPDNVAHQGDTLRHFTADGVRQSGGWDWGCSHSLDVRLAANTTALGAVCLSDCYPSKGIHYNHRGAELSSEPSGNCSGGSSAAIGGVAPDATGFWVSYASSEGRQSRDIAIVHVTNGGGVAMRRWLTDDMAADDAPHLASFGGGGGMLAGWRQAQSYVLQRLDAAAAPIDAPVTITARFGTSDDFFTHANGDVGWAAGSGSELQIARVRRCD